MNTYKRIDGDYTIQSVNATDRVVIDSNTVDVQGNLTVSGNLTYINTTELEVNDPFILLNRSNTESYSSNAGVLTHKTASTFAGIRYNVTDDRWELSSSTDTSGETGTWNPIAVGGNATAGGANTAVQFNNNGSFGGEAAFEYDSDTNQLSLDGSMLFAEQGAPPANVANSTVLYSNTVGSGGTGLYVANSEGNDELVSRSKAIVFGLIF